MTSIPFYGKGNIMVLISIFTTPRVRLYFEDTKALCFSFTEEFLRLSSMVIGAEEETEFGYHARLTNVVEDTLSGLHLPLDAEISIEEDGALHITLDVNSFVTELTPSVMLH